MNYVSNIFRDLARLAADIMGLIFSVLRHLIIPTIFLLVGWSAGAKYGAPDWVLRAVASVVDKTKTELSPAIVEAASDSVEYVVDTVEEHSNAASAHNGDQRTKPNSESEPDKSKANIPNQITQRASVTPATTSPEGNIIICKMRVSNAPRSGQPEANIGSSSETVSYNGATLLLMPATDSCLSSGFGQRNGKLHKGIDYFSDTGGKVLASDSGVIVEAVFRNDFGNMIVIDHGNGVYTRYAHLARFGSGVTEGATVSRGQVLGPIGNSGSSSIVHLHFEVLSGDFNTPAKSFGLEAVDPYNL